MLSSSSLTDAVMASSPLCRHQSIQQHSLGDTTRDAFLPSLDLTGSQGDESTAHVRTGSTGLHQEGLQIIPLCDPLHSRRHQDSEKALMPSLCPTERPSSNSSTDETEGLSVSQSTVVQGHCMADRTNLQTHLHPQWTKLHGDVIHDDNNPRCYTDLGIRNLAALFVSLSDDVKRQKAKMQKHSVWIFHFLISRQIEKRKNEVLFLWRASVLSLSFASLSSSSTSLNLPESVRAVSSSPKMQKSLSTETLRSTTNNKEPKPVNRKALLVSPTTKHDRLCSKASTSNHFHVVVDSISIQHARLSRLFARWQSTLVQMDGFWTAAFQMTPIPQ